MDEDKGQMPDRREAKTERITTLTGEIGAIEAELMTLWPWERARAKALTEELAKLRADLHAELGDRAASMAARAVVRPLEEHGAKLSAANLRLDELFIRLDELIIEAAKLNEIIARLDEEDRALITRLVGIEAGQIKQDERLDTLEASE